MFLGGLELNVDVRHAGEASEAIPEVDIWASIFLGVATSDPLFPWR
jgi:hypothetical protein